MTKSPVSLDFELSLSDVEHGSKQILQKIRPDWDLSAVKFKYFDEGITNILVGCHTARSLTEADDVVVIRVFGKKTDLIIDRKAERDNMIKLSENDLCPPLYAEFKNGIAYGFAQGVTLDEKTVRDDNIRKLIAKEMVRLHSLDRNPEAKSILFKKLEVWLASMPEKFDDSQKQKLFIEQVPSKETMTHELRELQNCLSTMPYPAVYSHNDLLLKNVIYNEKENKVTFIDHEYGMFNYQPFDIGNHFCEYAGIGDTLDYDNLYPSEEYQLGWIRIYMEEWARAEGSGTAVTDQDVRTMYYWVQKCAMAAHYFWGLWAIIQARFSEIDFNYLGYGILRLNAYFAWKEKVLAMK